MSSFPNSHTTAFAKIPRQIEKTWTRGYMRNDTTLSKIPNPSKHRYSAIQSVSLRVEYEPVSAFIESSIDLNDSLEHDDDQIRLWKENRLFWRDLETAVESAVEAYIQRVQEELYSPENRAGITFTAPCRRQIKIAHCESDSNEYSDRQPLLDDPGRSVADFNDNRTLGPDDSVTVADSRQLQEIIEKSTRDAAAQAVAQYKELHKSQKHSKGKSSAHKKQSGFAHSVASYIRT